MSMFKEVKVAEFILMKRERGETPEQIREVLNKHFGFLLDELIPMSDRMLESWKNAMIINGEE